MTPCGDHRWEATVPGDRIGDVYDVQVAVEAIDRAGRGAFAPDIDSGAAAFEVAVHDP